MIHYRSQNCSEGWRLREENVSSHFICEIVALPRNTNDSLLPAGAFATRPCARLRMIRAKDTGGTVALNLTGKTIRIRTPWHLLNLQLVPAVQMGR